MAIEYVKLLKNRTFCKIEIAKEDKRTETRWKISKVSNVSWEEMKVSLCRSDALTLSGKEKMKIRSCKTAK